MAKVQDVLKSSSRGFGGKGTQLSVEEARAAMVKAGEAPTSWTKGTGENTPVVPATPPVVPAAATPVPEPVAPAESQAAPEPPKQERIENNKFVLEIFQEDGQWVGQITYKNGAGPERFEAPTRKLLDMKLLEGKANATLRVREAIRREKYGLELDQVYPLPEGVTLEAFEKQPQAQQNAWVQSIARTSALEFRETHPEYYFCDENADKVTKFLGNKGLPVTMKNLEYAFAELADVDELLPRPQPQAISVQPAVASSAADSAARAALVDTPPATSPAPAAVAPAPAPVVRKRGSTGLVPGDSSAAPVAPETPEGGEGPKELSAAELRALSPIGSDPRKSQLSSEYQKLMADRRKLRQF